MCNARALQVRLLMLTLARSAFCRPRLRLRYTKKSSTLTATASGLTRTAALFLTVQEICTAPLGAAEAVA